MRKHSIELCSILNQHYWFSKKITNMEAIVTIRLEKKLVLIFDFVINTWGVVEKFWWLKDSDFIYVNINL